MMNRKKSSKYPADKVSRRNFLGAAMATAVTAATVSSAAANAKTNLRSPARGKFKLKYAPAIGAFTHHVGKDMIDQLKFMADEGFSACFTNGLMGRPKQQQIAIAKELLRLDMTLGPFVAYADFKVKSFVTRDKAIRAMLKEKIKSAVEVAKRADCKWMLVVPGRYDDGLEWAYQTANVIDNLKYCAEICESAAVTIVIEPLNPWKNHPGLFLTGIPQSYQICKAVNSPSCKIVNDLYHQQITEGNLIPNIDMAWDQIASFHLGDNPGRNEPTTGEINYKNIFKHLYQKGYKGVLCMEHGSSKSGKEGERTIIEAYRACDDF